MGRFGNTGSIFPDGNNCLGLKSSRSFWMGVGFPAHYSSLLSTLHNLPGPSKHLNQALHLISGGTSGKCADCSPSAPFISPQSYSILFCVWDTDPADSVSQVPLLGSCFQVGLAVGGIGVKSEGNRRKGPLYTPIGQPPLGHLCPAVAAALQDNGSCWATCPYSPKLWALVTPCPSFAPSRCD